MADQGSACSGDVAASAGRRSFKAHNAEPASPIATRAAVANQARLVLRAAIGTLAATPATGMAESVGGASAGSVVSTAFAGGTGTGGVTLWISGMYEPGGSSMR